MAFDHICTGSTTPLPQSCSPSVPRIVKFLMVPQEKKKIVNVSLTRILEEKDDHNSHCTSAVRNRT